MEQSKVCLIAKANLFTSYQCLRGTMNCFTAQNSPQREREHFGFVVTPTEICEYVCVCMFNNMWAGNWHEWPLLNRVF